MRNESERRSTMRVKLTGDRRERLLRSMHDFFEEQLEEDISTFRAEQLLDFFVRELGPPVYNQAIRDAHAFFEEKLTDLEGEFYEPEDPYTE